MGQHIGYHRQNGEASTTLLVAYVNVCVCVCAYMCACMYVTCYTWADTHVDV